MNFLSNLFFVAVKSRADFQSVISKPLITGKSGTEIPRPDKNSFLQLIPSEKMFDSCNEFINRITFFRLADNTGNSQIFTHLDGFKI